MLQFKLFLVFVVSIYSITGLSIPQDLDEDDHMHPDIDSPIDKRFNLEREKTAEYWINNGKETIRKHKKSFLNTNKAKNVIMFLGDGLSIPTVTAARTYKGQLDGKPGEEDELSFEKFPILGLSKTYCVDRQVADSACTATAYLGGVKANFHTVGLTANAKKNSCEGMKDTSNHVDSLLKKASDRGQSTGIVTTTRVTHASPSGAYAHSANRYWENDVRIAAAGVNITECRDIAHQLIHNDPGNKFKVILGGGRREFHPITTLDEENQLGIRLDGRDLIQEWKTLREEANDKYEYIWNREQLKSVSEDTEYLMGLFEASHCKYHLEGNEETEPTLNEMVEAAIKILSKNDNGFVLFVEGGRIDQAHHGNKAWLALDETVEFSKAVETAVDMTNEDDTLIVVTADHSHTMTISGYPSRGNPILGETDLSIGQDEIPYTTISYANGPGYRIQYDEHRIDVTLEDMEKTSFRYPNMVPLISETHGGDDVAVYAFGPWQHLFTGTYEQSAISHMISYAACLDDDYSSCTDD